MNNSISYFFKEKRALKNLIKYCKKHGLSYALNKYPGTTEIVITSDVDTLLNVSNYVLFNL